MKILVTGGPVHAYLDSVKILTNRFKGGRMAQLAGELADNDVDIVYLTSQNAILPACQRFPNDKRWGKVTVVYHNGFHDYMAKVLELAPEMDAVILGAAVVNLIPVTLYGKEELTKEHSRFVGGGRDALILSNPTKMPLDGKFPSHDYKVGDRIFMEWTIAPRVVDEVKKVAPKTKLFAFKLLQGVPHEELIEAAYEIVLESKAVAVFANDANDLDTKYAVTKEKTVLKLDGKFYDDFVEFILDSTKDEYYRTVNKDKRSNADLDAIDIGNRLVLKHKDKFKTMENGLIFGCVAVRTRSKGNSFLVTTRGKKIVNVWTEVRSVDHQERVVYLNQPEELKLKASLNAPFLHRIFEEFDDIVAIVHYHEEGDEKVPKLEYAHPGTVRDSLRDMSDVDSFCKFEIKGHGTFELLLEEDIDEL